MTHERRATLVILDGARPDVFAHLAARGDLPNISRLVLEPGGTVPATTVFPSTTGVAYLPFLTGCFPGTCNVPGIRWFDRSRYAGHWWRDRNHIRNYCGYQGELLNRDVPADLKSLFEIEPDSVAVCTPWTRGLSGRAERAKGLRVAWGGLAHYTGGYGWLDQVVSPVFVRAGRERHRLVFGVFPGIDGITHFYDPWHPEVFTLYRRMDAVLGRYAAAGGFDGDHLIALVSDHGMTRIDRHTEVSHALEARGLPTLRHPLLWRRNPKVGLAVSGNSSAQVYLDLCRLHSERWDIDEIEAGQVPSVPRDLVTYLASLDGVALVAGKSRSEIVLVNASGRARIAELGGGQIRYTVESSDVLHVGKSTVVMHERQWLAESLSGPFPDAPMQLLQIFRSSRAGELALSAAPGYDLRREWEIPEHRSGHGGLDGGHMRSLIALNQHRSGIMRSVDIFPLILQHLELSVPIGIDGVLPVQQQVRRQEVA